jgi:hypothetical protein
MVLYQPHIFTASAPALRDSIPQLRSHSSGRVFCTKYLKFTWTIWPALTSAMLIVGGGFTASRHAVHVL